MHLFYVKVSALQVSFLLCIISGSRIILNDISQSFLFLQIMYGCIRILAKSFFRFIYIIITVYNYQPTTGNEIIQLLAILHHSNQSLVYKPSCERSLVENVFKKCIMLHNLSKYFLLLPNYVMRNGSS